MTLDAERWAQVRRLLGELLELDAPAREQRLAGLDAALAGELRGLLAAAPGDASDLFEEAVGANAAALLADLGADRADGEGDGDGGDAAGASLAGSTVGPWRLERLLGRGGMAEVWEARRADGQFEQTVAVKLVKRGMDSEEIVRRFLRERQILARLEHPGIARLFDGGLAADGRPYFVLERVEGKPITEWCAEHNLGVAERLRLLVDCCEAVAAAHRRLVVHRDLKPTNILVTTGGAGRGAADGAGGGAPPGQVKLLDFGIAKLLADEGEEATRAELRVLTPAYAAPEQILGEPVSTATDVYALGVLAYELLTGRLPHKRSGRRAAELASELAGESIARPSTAVLSRADEGAAPSATAKAPRERRKLARTLAGDLDTIVMTALRREPERRYPSVAAFAEDLERHLSGRPVTARPDTFRYRAGKFVGRHRLGVVAATLAICALVGTATVALLEARRAERAAASQRAATATARAEATKQEAMTTFLTEVFTAADPEGRRAADLTARELVQQGAARIDQRLAEQPASRAAMLHVLGTVQYRLGLFDEAQPLLERALAVRRTQRPAVPLDVAATAAALGVLYHRQGRTAEGVKLIEEATALHRAGGPGARLDVAKDLNNLGNAYKALGRNAEARAAFEESIAIHDEAHVPDPGQLARVLNNYGLFLTRADEPVAARAALERALALHERASGPNSALVSGTLGNLSELYIRLHEVDRAVAATRRALAISKATYGPKHYETGLLENEAGWALLAAHRPAEARTAFEHSLVVMREAVGDDHRSIAYVYRNLGQALMETEHPAEAIENLRRAESIWIASHGPDDPDLASIYVLLGPLLIEGGGSAEGERLLLRAVELKEKPGAATVGAAWLALGRARLRQCRLADAREALTAAKAQVTSHQNAVWVPELRGLERELGGASCANPGALGPTAPPRR
jgi:serine/threonine-protein kinase